MSSIRSCAGAVPDDPCAGEPPAPVFAPLSEVDEKHPTSRQRIGRAHPNRVRRDFGNTEHLPYTPIVVAPIAGQLTESRGAQGMIGMIGARAGAITDCLFSSTV